VNTWSTTLKRMFAKCLMILISSTFPGLAVAATKEISLNLHMTNSKLGLFALIIFAVSYIFVMAEEFINLRKSKPVMLVAGVIWVIIACICNSMNLPDAAEQAVLHNLVEYAELFLFLLVAMTYVNAMEERNIFESLRSWLVSRGYSYRQLFWITGFIAFFLSPIADNLTTALLMCAVVMAVGADNPRFVGLSCINIVVAANAGGAFSPFGDITTLMVWQEDILQFQQFLHLFLPSLIAYILPAALISLAVPKVQPDPNQEMAKMKFGAKRIVLLFLVTISMAVIFHNTLHLPPVLGMMTGLSFLMFFAYYIKKVEHRTHLYADTEQELKPFDIFNKIKHAEWDTLFFFYGVIMCVGGLATLGYLELASNVMYVDWGSNLTAMHKATPANITMGLLSAVVDNIPVMYAVLTMLPSMSEGQWLLVTLTTGIGGSLLSIGSAAGVALMGQSKGRYTFFSHLRWIWAIAIGYFAAIACHIWLNKDLFNNMIT